MQKFIPTNVSYFTLQTCAKIDNDKISASDGLFHSTIVVRVTRWTVTAVCVRHLSAQRCESHTRGCDVALVRVWGVTAKDASDVIVKRTHNLTHVEVNQLSYLLVKNSDVTTEFR